MGFFSEDMEPMIDIYQRETLEQVDEIEGSLVEVVRDGAFAKAQVDALFRLVHTMKSSAAMMGMADLSTCAHRLEDLFDAVRSEPALMAGHEVSVIDVLYSFVDYVRDDMLRVDADDFQPTPDAGLLDEIEAVLGQLTVVQPESDPTPAPQPDAAGEDDHAIAQERFGMVSFDQLTMLQTIVGDLVMSHAILKSSASAGVDAYELESLFATCEQQLRDLEYTTSALSLAPVRSVTSRYYRVVHEIAHEEGKQVTLQVTGEDAQMNRGLLEALTAPLIHLIRNAVDHGIESSDERVASGKNPTGTVTLAVEAHGGLAEFRVSDDGAGIDIDAVLAKAARRGLLTKPVEQYGREEVLDFIFLPGFSMSNEVGRYSGRGVGMDVVQDMILTLGGSVTVSSVLHEGTTFTLRVPVPSTSQECIVLAVGPHTCLVPLRNIGRVCTPDEREHGLRRVDGRLWFASGDDADALLPVIDMSELYGVTQPSRPILMVVKGSVGSACLQVGEALGRQLTVERSLPDMVGRRYRADLGMSGCATLEDGSLGFVLNIEHLVSKARKGVADDV